MADNTWRELAEKTGPCPDDWHKRVEAQIALAYALKQGCPTCHGTGQVPLIPGLRKPCATRVHDRFQHPKKCPNCGGTGWLPVSGPEAIVAAQEYILNQPDPGDHDGFLSLEMEHDKAGYYVYIRTWPPDAAGWRVRHIGEGSTLEAALRQALRRALGKKP